MYRPWGILTVVRSIQSVLAGEDDQAESVGDADLFVNDCQVVADGAFAEEKAVSDLLVL